MIGEILDPSLCSSFLDGEPSTPDARWSWMPGHSDRYSESIRQHCASVTVKLLAAGRRGPRRSLTIWQFVELFLSDGQWEYLHGSTRPPKRVTVDTLPEPGPPSVRYALQDPATMDPWQFIAGALPHAGGWDEMTLFERLRKHRDTERWRRDLWPEFKKAMKDFIPRDLWPWGGGNEYSPIPYY